MKIETVLNSAPIEEDRDSLDKIAGAAKAGIVYTTGKCLFINNATDR